MQYKALLETFEKAYSKDHTDYTAKELVRLYTTPQYKVLLLFMFPILKDLRRITKLFQLNSGNNIEIYEELKGFIYRIAKRFLKPSVIERNNIYQLMNLDLSTEFNLLPLNSVDYSTAFDEEMPKFDPQTRNDLKTFARNYLKEVFTGMQGRIATTLKTLQ